MSKFNKVASLLGLIVSLIVIWQFYQERKKEKANATNPNKNISTDANKQVEILNPGATNGAIVQTGGGSGKPNGIMWLNSGPIITTPMFRPLDDTLGNVPSKQDNLISNVAPIRGDIYTPSDMIAITAMTSQGSMFGNNLPDPSMTLFPPFPNMGVDVIPIPVDRGIMPNLNLGGTPIALGQDQIPLAARGDSPYVNPTSLVNDSYSNLQLMMPIKIGVS